MKNFDFDIEKYLDSLTVEELRAAAKVGISVSLRCLTVTIQSLSKMLSASKDSSLK